MRRDLLAVLVLGISIVGLSIGATVPLVALRLHQLEASTIDIGILSALPAAGMIAAAFSVNWLTRRFSRREIYLVCFSCSALSIAGIELVSSTLFGLALVRLVMGVTAGVVIILGEAWVNEIAVESYRGRVVAIYTTCFTVFQMFGPGLLTLFGTEGPLLVTIVIIGHLLVITGIGVILPKQLYSAGPSESRSFSLLGFIRVAPALCMGVVFFAFFDSVALSMFPVYAVDQGYIVPLAVFMVTIILLGDAVFQFPLGWLSDRVDRERLYLICGLIALLVGACLPILMRYPLMLWPSLVILGAVAGGVYTLALILIGGRFKGPDLVTANACAGLLWGVGSLLGPLVSGAAMMASASGLPWVLSLMAALFVLIVLLFTKKQVLATRLPDS